MEIRLVEVELFRADEHTYMHTYIRTRGSQKFPGNVV
jgi:hypothetical protein